MDSVRAVHRLRALADDVRALLWPKVRAIGNVPRHDHHGLSDRIIPRVVTDGLPQRRLASEALERQFGEAP